MLSRFAQKSAPLRNIVWLEGSSRPINTTALKVEGPERDLVNFPRIPNREEHSPTRMGLFPESWFTNFHDKTGVTGPYVFGGSVLTFLYSKELLVLDHEFYTGLSLFMIFSAVNHNFGTQIREFLTKAQDDEDQIAVDIQQGQKDGLRRTIESAEDAISVAGSQAMVAVAKKENIALQLEASYRARMAEVYQAVKKRLDYQLEIVNVKTRIEQRHMSDWIINNVKQSITPTQEAATLKQCMTDLKALAARA